MAINAPQQPDRMTREQTTRSALEAESPSYDWEPAAFTAAPPPRPDMEQRWVRCRLGAGEDIANLLKRRQQGWTPRPVDSVSKNFQFLAHRLGDFGNVIQNQDSVLMERPIAIGDKMRAHVQEKTQRYAATVRNMVENNSPRAKGTLGGQVDELSVQSTVGHGRIPIIPD